MHHKNHKHSTENFKNPQHQEKPKLPSQPAPSSERRSVLKRLTERFREKPATADEVKQLRLNTQREVLKTQMQRAKSSRPSRFNFGGGGSSGSSYRRTTHRYQQDSGLFGGGNSGGGGLLNFGEGPSLNFLTGNQQKPRRGKQDSGFGEGLKELF